ncbi:MAG: ribonuclease PH [Chloroflexota bacterium]|nr:ribonuclease PH [Chloroflexota bacterium]
MHKRLDGRNLDQLRPISIEMGYQAFAEGSALIRMGMTHVLCSVSVEDKVPSFLDGTGQGWVTAEYSMLPRSTNTRTPRQNKTGGRAQEIQRLIGRSLRAVTDLDALGSRTLSVDCDVIQADGGTRTASITGAYIALYQALASLVDEGKLESVPLKSAVAATSAGVIDGEVFLDLCYEEDHTADVDFNVVMTEDHELVEIQGTSEGELMSREYLEQLLSITSKGISELIEVQNNEIANLNPLCN